MLPGLVNLGLEVLQPLGAGPLGGLDAVVAGCGGLCCGRTPGSKGARQCGEVGLRCLQGSLHPPGRGGGVGCGQGLVGCLGRLVVGICRLLDGRVVGVGGLLGGSVPGAGGRFLGRVVRFRRLLGRLVVGLCRLLDGLVVGLGGLLDHGLQVKGIANKAMACTLINPQRLAKFPGARLGHPVGQPPWTQL